METAEQSELTPYDKGVLIAIEMGKFYTVPEIKARVSLLYPTSLVDLFARLFGLSPGNVVRSVVTLRNNGCLRAIPFQPGIMKYQLTSLGLLIREQ